MIPEFPQFKPLEISDQTAIHSITQHLPPYSDANFVSLWSWNVQETTKVSVLNDNLVICMPDYLTQKPCYFLCGDKAVEESIRALCEYNDVGAIESSIILLVPQLTLDGVKFVEGIEIAPDERNHDYILSVEQLVLLAGNKWRGKRGHVNRFKRLYDGKYKIEKLDLTDPAIVDAVRSIFNGWNDKKRHDEDFFENEPKAFERLLAAVGKLDIICIGVTIDGQLEGFSVIEKANADYVVIHFEKANTAITGIYTFLNQAVAVAAQELGCTFINYEQDLGIVGLEQAKKQYFPVDYLTKHAVNRLGFSPLR